MVFGTPVGVQLGLGELGYCQMLTFSESPYSSHSFEARKNKFLQVVAHQIKKVIEILKLKKIAPSSRDFVILGSQKHPFIPKLPYFSSKI